MALNAHRVFAGPAAAKNYLASLNLDATQEQGLREARDLGRKAIHDGLRNWSEIIEKSNLFEGAIASSPPLRPKFKMQGSFAYRTLNDPAVSPPQEVDLDDGVFLPVSFLKKNGSHHPALISSGYFTAVEKALTPVCKKNGWRLITNKSSCVRVKLNSNAHMDFALYAIPDDEFDKLIEAEILAKRAQARDHGLLQESMDFLEYMYTGLREDQIMLAHREQGWKPSDPRKLENWFRSSLESYGEQIRRVCRYLKGWRDYRWQKCGLSSITLMACVAQVYEQLDRSSLENRDDIALLKVSEYLPTILEARIPNPVVGGQYLDEGWSQADRSEFIQAAQELQGQLRDALEGTDNPKRALSYLIRAFGERIPNDHALIQVPETSTPVVLTSGLIKKIGEEAAPQRAVKREGDRRYG
jgi:hypothetical protein